MQTAYEILSDPQERAWYDSHRDAILRNEDTHGGEHYEHNVRFTTADDIMRMYMSFDGRLDFSDSASGFYSTLRGIFDNLAREETLSCEWEGLEPTNYPSFGSSFDTYESHVKNFYIVWANFATRKTFSWKEVFRYSEAPDRRIRRTMEKENKRFRDEGIREFNEAVRALVAFVRKRDPRYTPVRQSEEERQKILRDRTAAQAARSRAANEAKLNQRTLPAWTTSSEPDLQDIGAFPEDEQGIEEEYECVVCRKSFKSENQWQAHEKSKKHVKAVQQLSRAMLDEGEALGLDDKSPGKNMEMRSQGQREKPGVDTSKLEKMQSTDAELPSEDQHTANVSSGDQRGHDSMEVSTDNDSSVDLNDEYAPREEIERRILGQNEDIPSSRHPRPNYNIYGPSHVFATTSTQEHTGTETAPKLGKAKEKRAKKAAQKMLRPRDTQQQVKDCDTPIDRREPVGDNAIQFNCAACQAGFSSKTRLFNHIKDFDHAQPLVRGTPGKKGKNR